MHRYSQFVGEETEKENRALLKFLEKDGRDDNKNCKH